MVDSRVPKEPIYEKTAMASPTPSPAHELAAHGATVGHGALVDELSEISHVSVFKQRLRAMLGARDRVEAAFF